MGRYIKSRRNHMESRLPGREGIIGTFIPLWLRCLGGHGFWPMHHPSQDLLKESTAGPFFSDPGCENKCMCFIHILRLINADKIRTPLKEMVGALKDNNFNLLYLYDILMVHESCFLQDELDISRKRAWNLLGPRCCCLTEPPDQESWAVTES